MDQHPVPQNISSYEFRLVGDMTLKQFLQLAGGAGVGLIIFRLPLPDFIKWPLVIIAAGTGALMAFVPIQGRPFTQWLLAFIKAIYAPTEFFWSPSLLSSPSLGEDARRAGEVLPKIVTPSPAVAPAKAGPPLPAEALPRPTVAASEVGAKAGPLPLTKPAPAGEVGPLSPAEVASFQTLPTAPVQPTIVQTEYAKASALPLPSVASAKEGPSVPATPPPAVSSKPTMNYQPTNQVTNLGPSPLTPSLHIAHPPSTTSSTTAPNIPPPSLPNLLTGLIVTSQNQPQEGAIVEIVANATGLPVRALRTSKSGTFQIATPLPDGLYSLYIDKDGLTFDPVSITAEGNIIQPIIIKAKS